MTDSRKVDVTDLLVAWKDGDPAALDELIPVVYDELRRLARHQLAGERRDHSLQPTALTHEAFVRLLGTSQVGWQDRAHFFAVASRVMRRVLVDHARRRGARKRGGDVTQVRLDDADTPAAAVDVDLIALNEALDGLQELDERQSQVVELRYFAGLTEAEAAEVLGVSQATVKRDWRVAKLWLRRALQGGTAA